MGDRSASAGSSSADESGAEPSHMEPDSARVRMRPSTPGGSKPTTEGVDLEVGSDDETGLEVQLGAAAIPRKQQSRRPSVVPILRLEAVVAGSTVAS
eukprot:tig00000403_g318.t1